MFGWKDHHRLEGVVEWMTSNQLSREQQWTHTAANNKIFICFNLATETIIGNERSQDFFFPMLVLFICFFYFNFSSPPHPLSITKVYCVTMCRNIWVHSQIKVQEMFRKNVSKENTGRKCWCEGRGQKREWQTIYDAKTASKRIS